jgi:hypothetical protein
VTHAALSLAEALGAELTLLAGADFSYPEGKSYSRGTYIYGYYDRSQARLSPLESLFSGFVFRNPMVYREEDRDSDGRSFTRYLTKPLMAYREHLEAFAARTSMAIVPLRGKGVEIRTPRARATGQRERRVFAPGPAAGTASTFLKDYLDGLRALPSPRDPAMLYLGGLGPADRDLWTTLLPTASAFQRAAGPKGMKASDLLGTTRSWAVTVVEEALAEQLDGRELSGKN